MNYRTNVLRNYSYRTLVSTKTTITMTMMMTTNESEPQRGHRGCG